LHAEKIPKWTMSCVRCRRPWLLSSCAQSPQPIAHTHKYFMINVLLEPLIRTRNQHHRSAYNQKSLPVPVHTQQPHSIPLVIAKVDSASNRVPCAFLLVVYSSCYDANILEAPSAPPANGTSGNVAVHGVTLR